MLKKCILFGAGFYGKGAYYKLRKSYDIIFYVDNSESIQGKKIYDIPVMSVSQMMEIYDEEEMDIIICSQAYYDIANQLVDLGIVNYYVLLEGFLYRFSETEVMMPVELCKIQHYRKEEGEKNILFVQNTACIRTHKIASIMKNNGYRVFLLYTIAPPEFNNESFKKVYDNVYTFYTSNSMIDFVNESDFDLIHSSNEPDLLTNYLLLSNKKIVFDTHDMRSIRDSIINEALVLEYIANTRSAGTIYTSEGVREIAIKKYNIPREKTFALENLIFEQIIIQKKHKKLSQLDGAIHCVYEGGIVGNNVRHHRFFENLWKKITDCGIHIHFYSQSDYEYCISLDKKSKYLHFEGNMGSKELVTEMTKYDCGLTVFNVNESNRLFLETGTANKIYEYLNAGLPVIVGNIDSYINFVEKYKVGIYLDLEGDIKEQLTQACKIQIEDNFLVKNRMTMDSYSKDLEAFYQKIINEDKS